LSVNRVERCDVVEVVFLNYILVLIVRCLLGLFVVCFDQLLCDDRPV